MELFVHNPCFVNKLTVPSHHYSGDLWKPLMRQNGRDSREEGHVVRQLASNIEIGDLGSGDCVRPSEIICRNGGGELVPDGCRELAHVFWRRG